MIARIIELSVRNRFLVMLLTAIIVGLSVWSVFHLKLDAIPDLSDVQVIVVTEYPGQNPQVVDDQVTYPLASSLLSVPGATVVRGFSMFELSFVYVLFEDGTDIYWARSRVLEYLNFARDRLPQGVEPKLGPDATGVGWVYQYVLHPGWYCADHPKGLFHDELNNKWYAQIEHAHIDRQSHLTRVRAFDKPGTCPIDGSSLVSANLDLSQLRSIQDWYLRYPLTSVEGVSEVAPIGGFVRQYQVILDPQKLQAFGLPLRDVVMAIERSNNDVGGSVVELSEMEYMVRSRGYLKGFDDLAKVPVMLGEGGVPVMLGDVATLTIGGEARRGIGEYNGEGEAVGGIVVARFGENAYKVIQDVKAKLHALEDGLPPGVSIKTTYDRSDLINRSITTLRRTLIEEIIVVGLVCMLMLLHLRSELVAVFVVPSSVIIALLVMHLCGINANIMSLGGIAIAIGVVVDSAIVMVENAHKHLDRLEDRHKEGARRHGGTEARSEHSIVGMSERADVILAAAKEVGPSLFFSLLIITVSFLPVFVLEGEAGRLFKPLAFTKTFAMAAAAILSITIIPVLMVYFITGRVLPKRWGWFANTMITLSAMLLPAVALWMLMEDMQHLRAIRVWIAGGWAVLMFMLLVPQKIIHENRNPVSRFLQWLYEPFFWLAMKWRWAVLIVAAAALASTWYPMSRLGTEFMPALDEGDLLYMPTSDPSISANKSRELLQQTDKLIKTFPEVIDVHGKIGRADTATDPAPLSMIETVVRLNPDHSKWRTRPVHYFFSDWPDWLKKPFTSTFWPESRTITTGELAYGWTDPDATFHPGLNDVVSIPGVANAWPHPIANRITMLATGIKTPVGIKILGPDLQVLSDLATKAASAVHTIDGTISAYADRTFGGYYLDFDINREKAARYGLTTGDVQDVIQTAIGGMKVTTTVEGLERYPLNVRYARDFRDDIPALKNVLVDTPSGNPIPLGEVATISIHPGAPMIRSENAQRTAWVFVDFAGRDIGSYIKDARAAIAREVALPQGYTIVFAGQFEFWEKTIPRLVIVSIVTLAIIVLLLYMASRSWFRVCVIMLAVPFSLIGAFWFLWMLDYNMSLAVVIGIIALAGLDAETGMVMLLYLDNSYDRALAAKRALTVSPSHPLTPSPTHPLSLTPAELWAAIHDGAVMRIRPKTMTVAATFIGLVPLLWATGTGADVMRRLAAPMIGGLTISFIMELLVYPVIFYTFKRWTAGVARPDNSTAT